MGIVQQFKDIIERESNKSKKKLTLWTAILLVVMGAAYYFGADEVAQDVGEILEEINIPEQEL